MRLKVMVAVLGVLLGAAVAYAIVFTEDVIINGGDLEVRGTSGVAMFSLSWSDPVFGTPWMSMRDRGATPSELEVAPIPNQYDQVTVKTWLSILGKGTAPVGALEDTPPYDARLLMSGPWPASYCALRDDGTWPARLEVNALREYRDVVIRSGSSGDVIIELGG